MVRESQQTRVVTVECLSGKPSSLPALCTNDPSPRLCVVLCLYPHPPPILSALCPSLMLVPSSATPPPKPVLSCAFLVVQNSWLRTPTGFVADCCQRFDVLALKWYSATRHLLLCTCVALFGLVSSKSGENGQLEVAAQSQGRTRGGRQNLR